MKLKIKIDKPYQQEQTNLTVSIANDLTANIVSDLTVSIANDLTMSIANDLFISLILDKIIYSKMKLNLLSCDAHRPDKRAIARCLTEVANIDQSLSNELTDILLEGDPVDIEVQEKNSSSAFRALRKLSIDYEIVE